MPTDHRKGATSGNLPAVVRVEVVTGNAVISRLAEVRSFLEGSSQQHEVDDLPYLLSQRRRLAHRPCLLLMYGETKLLGAVVLFEFRSWLSGFRIFSCSSRRGRRTVLAPMEHRVEVAALAAQTLLERGARFVNIEIHQGEADLHPLRARLAFERGLELAAARLHQQNASWALHPGLRYFVLPLTSDFDTTMALIHTKTRRNLRYHRRRALADFGCRFVPILALDRESFFALHRKCDYPVSVRVTQSRYDALTRFPQTRLAGLQHRDGTWLALAGYRCGHGSFELDWQINRGEGIVSITTAMRAFLIGHAIEIGCTSFSIEGRTLTHSVLHSFRQHSVFNLAVRRESFVLRALVRGLMRFFPGRYVTLALARPGRVWRPL